MATSSYPNFTNDSVSRYTPITFGATFVREMRKTKGIANIPSIRTTLSIPSFLTARYFRKEQLDPMDYLEAAVYNTPFEDQEIAYRVARRLLFPERDKQLKKKKRTASEPKVSNQSSISGLDIIMSELQSGGFDDLLDFEGENMSSLDQMLQQQQDAWDFFETLRNSSNPEDQAILDLMDALSSSYAIIEHHLLSNELMKTYLKQQLADNAGNWSVDVFPPATTLKMNENLSRYAQMPWEIASAMGIAGDSDLKNYLEDMISNSSPSSMGKTLRYLNELAIPPSQDWVDKAFDKIINFNEYAEMVSAMNQYRKCPTDILQNAAKNDIAHSLDIAEKLNDQLNVDLAPELFKKWDKSHPQPSIDETLDATYDDQQATWPQKLQEAVSRECQSSTHERMAEIAQQLSKFQSDRLSPAMQQMKSKQANDTATQSMEAIPSRDQFLPQLEHFLNNSLRPNYARTEEAGKKLGVSLEDIAELYKQPLEILKSYVNDNIQQKSKYNSITQKIDRIPHGVMDQLVSKSLESNNSTAMSALGAIDLGAAMQASQGKSSQSGQDGQEMLVQALDKGVGGGTNLIKQWFIHRDRLPKHLREKLKRMIQQVLIEIGMDWANRGTGSTEEGIIPTNRNRPYRPSDELDSLDIEGTLENLIMSGKSIDQITEDDLIVQETSKGKTSLGVLIDISGSMSGQNLAMCSIAVVMLLGKLEEKEIAVAMFESNTHPIKGFLDTTDLDFVASELLELKARGGTRVSAALKWITEEFETVTDSEVKILYLLSDFFFTENVDQLSIDCDSMVSQGARILAAYHGRTENQKLNHMVEILDGNSMKITDFESLPKVIAEAISFISG